MKQYDSYKDSGVKWLGEIPSHWEILPIKRIAKTYAGATPSSSNEKNWGGIIPWITPADFKTETKYVKEGDRFLTPQGLKSCSTTLVPAMSVIFSKRAPVGQLSIATQPLCTNQGCLSCVPLSGVDSTFLFYLLSIYKETFESFSGGTTFKELSQVSFNNFRISLPPINEQIAMVGYLDAATSKIDEAIAQQQKMIDLLNERKQIIINNAVTKGLDPNVKMKPSGIDWIGDIPEHWEIRKLKTIVDKVGSGVTPRGGGSVYVDEGIMLLRSQNVYFEGFKLNDVAFITEAMDKEMGNTRVKEGDVLINITGGSIGRCHFVPKGFPRANVNQHVCIVRPRNFSSKYLYYLLRSNFCQLQVELQQTGGNREGLTSAALKNFVLSIPPENEQKKIIDYLDEKDKGLQYSIEICQKQISLLQERKQIVINDVVTGKVKVV